MMPSSCTKKPEKLLLFFSLKHHSSNNHFKGKIKLLVKTSPYKKTF